MIVVGIMGIILSMGVPIVYRAWKKAPMAKAISGIVEACSHARAQAIIQGHEVDLVFNPREGSYAVSGGYVPRSAPGTPAAAEPQSGAAAIVGPAPSGQSGKLPEGVSIDMFDINKLPRDFRLDDSARVRFFPNGTSDELTLILRGDRNEQRGIVLEVTTGLASVLNEDDLQSLLRGEL